MNRYSQGIPGSVSVMVVFLNHISPLDSQGSKMGINLVDVIAWLLLMYQEPLLEIQGSAVV